MQMNTIITTPVNLGTHTRYFPRKNIDFTVDALDINTGKAIKVISDVKVVEAFGIKNWIPIIYDSIGSDAVLVGTMGEILHVPIGSYKNRIPYILSQVFEREHFLKNFCKDALDEKSEAVRCIHLPSIYKALFGVELNQQQRLDLGIVIRNAIPEVKTRPKVLTIHRETKEPIWILHYTILDIPKIVEAMLTMHGY